MAEARRQAVEKRFTDAEARLDATEWESEQLRNELEWVKYEQDKWKKTRFWVIEGSQRLEDVYKLEILDKEAAEPEQKKDYAALKLAVGTALAQDIAEKLKLPWPPVVPPVASRSDQWPENRIKAAGLVKELQAHLTPDIIEMIKTHSGWVDDVQQRKPKYFTLQLEPGEGSKLKNIVRGFLASALFEACGLNKPNATKVSQGTCNWRQPKQRQ